MRKANIIASIMGIILSIYVFLEARTFPKAPGTIAGPGFFPMAIAVGLMIVFTLLIIQTVNSKKKDNDKDNDMDKLTLKNPNIRRSFTSLIATVIYILIMPFFGFIIATTFYLFFLMFLLKNREYIKMGIVSILVSIGVFLLFKTVLHITLPVGFWI